MIISGNDPLDSWEQKIALHRTKKNTRFLDFFDQTFLGLGLGKLFLTRESLVSDIPAGDGNIAKPFMTVYSQAVSHAQPLRSFIPNKDGRGRIFPRPV